MEQYSSRKVKSSTIPIEANINPAHGKRLQKYILSAYIRSVPREKLAASHAIALIDALHR